MRHHSSWIMRKEMRVEPRESGIEAASGWKDESTRDRCMICPMPGLKYFFHPAAGKWKISHHFTKQGE
ncbi:hypothetical protein IX51_11735 [uncultured archaeon]|nr:hypothetical protein IX51_11735 [uncultured archaeon]